MIHTIWINPIIVESNYHSDADADSDFLFDADLDPTFHPDADPDPDPSFKKRFKSLKKC